MDDGMSFDPRLKPILADISFPRIPVSNHSDLGKCLRDLVADATADGKAALALSGGIDSAILAKYMPRGSTAYTFKCVVPGVQVVDETSRAAQYARENGLVHKVIEITWDDMVKYAPVLMKHKGAPIHSIEVQIYTAALKAKKDGFTKLIFGENADIIYGGMNGLLAKDWTFGEFVDRYSYVKPYYILKNSYLILEPFQEFEINGHINGHDFVNKYFRREALGTYTNACATADVEFIGPYSQTIMEVPIDLERIRRGDTKYLIRELYKELYPNHPPAQKIPMPRPMNEWMKDWPGPQREDFYADCACGLTGDQKWMVYCLEMFLNMVEV